MVPPPDQPLRGYTSADLLDQIERNTGVRPDLKQNMLKLLDEVRDLIEHGSLDGTDLPVDGVDIILCNVETRMMRRATAGLVLRERPEGDEFEEGETELYLDPKRWVQ